MTRPKRGELSLKQKYKNQKFNFQSSPCNIHPQKKKRKEKITNVNYNENKYINYYYY